jgi:hypothetical protein
VGVVVGGYDSESQLPPPPRPPSLHLGAKPMLRIGVLGAKNGGRRDGLAGWGRETRTTESVRTEIRLRCRENFARFGQKRVHRGFQYELRVRASSAAAGLSADRVHWKGRTASGFELSHQGGWEDSNRGQAKKIIRAGGSFRSTSVWTEQCMWPTDTEPLGSLLSPASAARPPRGFGGGGALLRRYHGEEL